MPTNFWMFFIAALIPMLTGFLWYNPKTFEPAWKKVNSFTDADLEDGNMGIIFGVSYLFNVMIAFALSGIVIHQTSIFQMMMPEVMEAGSAAQGQFNELMSVYGNHHRNFGHGVVHGVIITLFFVMPMIGVNALFERRGFKYIFIHTGYWLITLSLMGGLLCETLKYT